LPENLLEKVFAGWFEFAGCDNEAEIEQTARDNSETTIPGGLGSFVLDFWRKRPTRLFSLLENYRDDQSQQYFNLLDQEIRRLPALLTTSHYSPEKLNKLQKLALTHNEKELAATLSVQKPASIRTSGLPRFTRQPAVPLIITGDRYDLPDVIFDHFSSDFALLISMPADNRVIWRHRLICQMFSERHKSEITTVPVLPMLCFPFPGFNAEGCSFEMGLWANLWLTAHNQPEIGRICCTGAIDTDNGCFLEVSFLEQKLAAAFAMGFASCLVPAAGSIPERFAGDSRVIRLHDVADLDNWLLINSGNGRNVRRVVSWLQSERRKPSQIDFSAFFAESPACPAEPVVTWKSMIGQLSPAARLTRLKALTMAYCNDIDTDIRRNMALLPTAFRYAALPWMLADAGVNTAMAEGLYSEFAIRCAESSPEIYLASRLLLGRSYQKLPARPEFTALRQRFPLLIWLFFREPTEMLATFSLIKKHNSSEKRALKMLLDLLSRHAGSYVGTSGNQRPDAAIMQKILRHVDPDARFRPGPVLTIRKRLLHLFNAMQNFSQYGHRRTADCCLRLLCLHLEHVTEKTGVDLTGLAQFLKNFHAGIAEEADLPEAPMPVLQDLLQAMTNAQNRQGSKDRSCIVHNLHKSFRRVLSGKSHEMPWFPQPGIAFVRAIMQNEWRSLPFFRISSQFAADNYQSPSGELRQACLAYWAGLICARHFPDSSEVAASRFFREAGGLRLPFVAGWLSQKVASADHQEIVSACLSLIENQSFPAETMFWFWLLPAECRAACQGWLCRQLNLNWQESTGDHLRQKTRLFTAMLHSLMSPGCDDAVTAFWQDSLQAWHEHAESSRRTMQALAPVYHLLSGSRAEALRHLRKNRHLVNSCEFAVAFLLRFSRFGRINYRLQPIPEIPLSYEQQLLDSLTIGYYRIYRPGLFNSYIIEQINDLPNLRLISDLS